MGYRVGQGFDVHRYRAGRRMRVAGVDIESDVGLEGHSDADVALHAVIDALLGAAALGDLGELFPAGDERWRDADSRDLATQVVELVRASGYEVVNCDLTVVGERPRIAPFRDAMRGSLASLLGISGSSVSVKATTTEGLGFTGRSEGLAALAVVLLAAAGHGHG